METRWRAVSPSAPQAAADHPRAVRAAHARMIAEAAGRRGGEGGSNRKRPGNGQLPLHLPSQLGMFRGRATSMGIGMKDGRVTAQRWRPRRTGGTSRTAGSCCGWPSSGANQAGPRADRPCSSCGWHARTGPPLEPLVQQIPHARSTRRPGSGQRLDQPLPVRSSHGLRGRPLVIVQELPWPTIAAIVARSVSRLAPRPETARPGPSRPRSAARPDHRPRPPAGSPPRPPRPPPRTSVTVHRCPHVRRQLGQLPPARRSRTGPARSRPPAPAESFPSRPSSVSVNMPAPGVTG